MKTIKKFIVGVLAAVPLCVSAVGFAGCGNAGELTELQKNIQELKTLVSEQTKKIEELKGENERLQETVENLEIKSTRGVFHTLEEAYLRKLLSVDDLKKIAYFQNGGRNGNEEIIEKDEEYEAPNELDASVEKLLKQTCWYNHYGIENSMNITVNQVQIVQYYGTYNGCVAVMVNIGGIGYADVMWEEVVAGVRFCYNNGNAVRVWEKLN